MAAAVVFESRISSPSFGSGRANSRGDPRTRRSAGRGEDTPPFLLRHGRSVLATSVASTTVAPRYVGFFRATHRRTTDSPRRPSCTGRPAGTRRDISRRRGAPSVFGRRRSPSLLALDSTGKRTDCYRAMGNKGKKSVGMGKENT